MIATMLLALAAAVAQDEGTAIVARVTRLADPVAAIDTEARNERMLFHWDKSVGIRVGDGMRQGVAGMGELLFTDDNSLVRSFGEATMYVTEASAQRHALRCDACARLSFEVKDIPLRIELPGGSVLLAQNTQFRVQLDDLGRRYVVRNAGAGNIKVSGTLVPPGTDTITAGHEMPLPVPVAPTDPVAIAADAATSNSNADAAGADASTQPAPPASRAPDAVDVWQGSTIRLGSGARATKKDSDLELEGPGVAQVGGARFVLEAGSRVTVWRPEP